MTYVWQTTLDDWMPSLRGRQIRARLHAHSVRGFKSRNLIGPFPDVYFSYCPETFRSLNIVRSQGQRKNKNKWRFLTEWRKSATFSLGSAARGPAYQAKNSYWTVHASYETAWIFLCSKMAAPQFLVSVPAPFFLLCGGGEERVCSTARGALAGMLAQVLECN